MSSRLIRMVEKWLTPWYDRADAVKAEEHSEAIRQRAISTRIEAERVSHLYRDRLVGRRS